MKLTGKHVLVVDDDADLRVLIRKVIEGVGCVVHEAGSVKEALQVLQTYIPDLIILDINMPEHSGLTYLSFRKKNGFLASIPVLVLSLLKDKRIINQALAMGASHYLEKPFQASLLLQKVRHVFHSADTFVYKLPEPSKVQVAVPAEVVFASAEQLRISSPVKLTAQCPITLHVDSLEKHIPTPLICKVDNRTVEINEGQYRQVVTPVGLSDENRAGLLEWRKEVAS